MHNIDPTLIALLDDVRKAFGSIPERFHEESIHILVRVVARLVPNCERVDGCRLDREAHSWLQIKMRHTYIIDLVPRDVYPGPILVYVGANTNYSGWYEYGFNRTVENDGRYNLMVDEILEATEAARRFLSVP